MLNKITWLAVASLIVLTAILYFIPSKETTSLISTNGVVVKEAVSDIEHYRLYIEDDKEFLLDMNANTSTLLKKVTSKPSPVLVLGEGYAQSKYDILKNSTLIDPESLNIGIKYSIPTTYESTLEQSSIYLETLMLDGWQISAKLTTADYIDLYMNKNNENSRIIILKNYIKIFDKVKGNFPNLLTYINE